MALHGLRDRTRARRGVPLQLTLRRGPRIPLAFDEIEPSPPTPSQAASVGLFHFRRSPVVLVFGRRDDDTIHALLRPASKKRQGTKSREVGHQRCRGRYEFSCAALRDVTSKPFFSVPRNSAAGGSTPPLPRPWGRATARPPAARIKSIRSSFFSDEVDHATSCSSPP